MHAEPNEGHRIGKVEQSRFDKRHSLLYSAEITENRLCHLRITPLPRYSVGIRHSIFGTENTSRNSTSLGWMTVIT
jgi:hypothetical protein